MEFYIEPSGIITISYGELLLTLSEDPAELCITVMLKRRRDYVCFNATDKPRGDFFFVRDDYGAVIEDIDNEHIFGLLLDAELSDTWHQVPQTLSSEITDVVDACIY